MNDNFDPKKANSCLGAGRRLLDRNEVMEALPIFEQGYLAIERDSNEEKFKYLTDVGIKLIACFEKYDNPNSLQPAFSFFQRALPEAPELSDQALIYNYMGRILSERGHLEDRADLVLQSIECFKATEVGWPKSENPSAWVRGQINLADTYIFLNQLESGTIIVTNAIAVLPQNSLHDWSRAHQVLGRALEQSRKIEKAITAYRTAVESARGPRDTARSLNDLGRCLTISGHFDEAIANLERASRFGPEKTGPGLAGDILLNLGIACSEKGNTAPTTEHYINAIDAFESARTFNSQENRPKQWAFITLKLADVYNIIAHACSRPDCAEKAVDLYGQALPLLNEENREAASDNLQLARSFFTSPQA